MSNTPTPTGGQVDLPQSGPCEPTPLDTPLLAAKRAAFDQPTQANLGRLIAEAKAESTAENAALREELNRAKFALGKHLERDVDVAQCILEQITERDAELARLRASQPIRGRVVHIGDLRVTGETVPGILVEVPREVLASLKENPLYRTVRIIVEPVPQATGA